MKTQGWNMELLYMLNRPYYCTILQFLKTPSLPVLLFCSCDKLTTNRSYDLLCVYCNLV